MPDPANAGNNSPNYPILLVEDDTQIYELLNQLIEKEFPQSSIIYKASFEEAVDYLGSLTGWLPRLIILDVDLKLDKSGLDILDWIRANENYVLIPVIILSIITEEEIVRDSYARGANAFTGKPFELQEWREYVRYLRSYWFEMAATPKLWLGDSDTVISAS